MCTTVRRLLCYCASLLRSITFNHQFQTFRCVIRKFNEMLRNRNVSLFYSDQQLNSIQFVQMSAV